MQSTETKGLEEKLDDETSASAEFSGIKKRDCLDGGQSEVISSSVGLVLRNALVLIEI